MFDDTNCTVAYLVETNFKSYNGCELNFFFKALEIKGKILHLFR